MKQWRTLKIMFRKEKLYKKRLKQLQRNITTGNIRTCLFIWEMRFCCPHIIFARDKHAKSLMITFWGCSGLLRQSGRMLINLIFLSIMTDSIKPLMWRCLNLTLAEKVKSHRHQLRLTTQKNGLSTAY